MSALRLAVICTTLAAACDADVLSGVQPEAPVPNAPPAPSRRWTESFDHRGQLQALEGSAVLDTNRGLLTLASETLPPLEGTGRVAVDREMAGAGIAEGEVVEVAGDLDVGDSLEIRASTALRISGHIRAGDGGLVLAAGRRVEIDGQLETSGPVELVVAQSGGEIIVRGAIRAPLIRLRGRGSARILGTLDARDLAVPPGTGEIRIDLYENVLVAGAEAAIRAGDGGTVRLETLGAVAVMDAARWVDDAAWSIGAGLVLIDEESALILGELAVVAAEQLIVGRESELESGGTEMSLVAGAIELGLGARVAGVGRGGTSLRLEAGQELRAGAGARVTSLAPSCERGAVFVRVGGPYIGDGEASFVPAPVAADCSAGTRNPVATVLAHRIEGIGPRIDGPGDGGFSSDPNLRVSVPAVQTEASGRWLARPFPVPVGATLRLDSYLEDRPEGTGVSLLLADTDDEDGDPRDFRPVEGFVARSRFVVAQIEIYGRRFDAPRLEEISFVWD